MLFSMQNLLFVSITSVFGSLRDPKLIYWYCQTNPMNEMSYS